MSTAGPPEQRSFAELMLAAKPPAPRDTFRPWVTIALIAINAAIYVLMLGRGVDALSPSVPDLIAWGANFGPHTLDGEAWRLATSMFLHIGALHLLFNMIVLWQYGWLVERLVGHVAFLAIYLCAGLLGSVTSVLWHPLLVSAGASGAIFGVVGALFGYLVMHRAAVPRPVLANLSRSTLIFLGINLYAGFTTAHVDMSAHVGGFFAGIAGGLIVASGRSAAIAGRRGVNTAILVAATAVVTLGALNRAPRVRDPIVLIARFDSLQQSALATTQAALTAVEHNNSSRAEAAAVIGGPVLRDWRAAERLLDSLTPQTAEERRRYDLVMSYARLRDSSFVYLAAAVATNDVRARHQFEAQDSAARRVKALLDIKDARDR